MLENIFANIISTAGFVVIVQVIALLFLCWMFRPTIIKAIEHLLGLQEKDERSANKNDNAGIIIAVFGVLLVSLYASNTHTLENKPPSAERQSEQIEQNIPIEKEEPPVVVDKQTAQTTSNEQKNDTPKSVPAPKQEQSQNIVPIRKDVDGRGISASEPKYEGLVGYVAVGYSDGDDKQSPYNTPWLIKTYERDKQFWNESGNAIEHKTEIVVKKQFLKLDRNIYYHGYLLVQRISDGKEFYINVKNFITKPYWTYKDIKEAAKVGHFIAVYNQKSDYYPVNLDNKKVDLPNGTLVFISGTTGTYGRGGPNNRTHQVEGGYWREDAQRYGGAFFNIGDLTIQY